MNRVITFVTDVWNLSLDRIRRADPLLMGAAIAYNSLFAMVPLAIAFIAILTLFDATDEVLSELDLWMTENLSADTSWLPHRTAARNGWLVRQLTGPHPPPLPRRGPVVRQQGGLCRAEGAPDG